MRTKTLLAAAGAALCLSAPAAAEGWAWTLITGQDSIDACKANATTAYDAYARAHSRLDTAEGSQAIYAYGLGRDGLDSVVYCIHRPGGRIDAMLITHSRDGVDNPRSGVHALLRGVIRDETYND